MQVSNINFLQNKYTTNSVAFKGHQALTMPLLRSIKNVTCVYCGQEMLTRNQIEDFAKKAAKLTGQRLSKFLTSYMPKMKPNERNVTLLIREAIKKNPHSNLQGVLEQMFPNHVQKLENQQKAVLMGIASVAKDFSPYDKKLTIDQIKSGLKSISNNSYDKHFKRNRYISDFYFLADKFENPTDHKKVMDTIASMPNTHTSIDALIVKYSRKSPYNIAYRLLVPNQSTIEHLHPRSLGGTNDIKNLVLACGKDNSTRSSQPLDTMSDLEKHLPEYFRTLKKGLAKKLPIQDFKQVKEYISDVTKTINSLLKDGLHICDNSKSRL